MSLSIYLSSLSLSIDLSNVYFAAAFAAHLDELTIYLCSIMIHYFYFCYFCIVFDIFCIICIVFVIIYLWVLVLLLYSVVLLQRAHSFAVESFVQAT